VSFGAVAPNLSIERDVARLAYDATRSVLVVDWCLAAARFE
jgi:hypothetical protein